MGEGEPLIGATPDDWEGVFSPGVLPTEKCGECLFFAFQDDRLLVHLGGQSARPPGGTDFGELGIPHGNQHYLGALDGRQCFAVDLGAEATAPPGMALEGLRKLWPLIGEDLFRIGGRAFQILEWDRTHRFCGRCGAATRLRARERALECPECGLLSFPRVSPAIIVLISKEREFLLARSPRFPKGMRSVIAGFAEPGETLEEAVMREVREEVGIEVRDVRYFGSQPWPFPHSLMVGFTASHASGEICIDGDEIEDAAWYTPDDLPDLPSPISISRRLIDSHLSRWT